MLYLLSKLLPLIVLPLGFSILLLFSQLLRKWNWLLFSSLSILSTFSLGIVSNAIWVMVESPWQRISSTKVRAANAIVVLSGGNASYKGPDRILEWSDPDRFFAGIQLYKSKKASKIIFTSERVDTDLYSSQIYTRKALDMGIPSASIISTKEVRNTADEAYEVKKILYNLKPRKNKSIILVTSAFHMNRAKNIFENQGVKVIPYPVDFRSNIYMARSTFNPYNWIPHANNLSKSSAGIREILGRAVYKVKYMYARTLD